MENKKVIFDVDGAEAVSKVLMNLLNEFPGLKSREIKFSTLSQSSGISFYPSSGAVLLINRKDIMGHVKQECQYPFVIVYRFAPKADAEQQKMEVQEFLDTLGKWLELQPIIIDDEKFKLSAYPILESGNRKIESISRTNSAHLDRVYDDKVEDWVISLSLKYKNEYDE